MTDPTTTGKPPIETLAELKEMATSYAKQETVAPLKNLGMWVAWGLAGAVLVIIGVIFMALGLLRLLQQEVGWDSGYSSLWPYLIVIGVLLVIAAIAGYAATRNSAEESPK